MATLQILLQLGVSATTTNKLELETQSRTLDLNLKHSTPVSLSYRPGDVETLHRHDTGIDQMRMTNFYILWYVTIRETETQPETIRDFTVTVEVE